MMCKFRYSVDLLAMGYASRGVVDRKLVLCINERQCMEQQSGATQAHGLPADLIAWCHFGSTTMMSPKGPKGPKGPKIRLSDDDMVDWAGAILWPAFCPG